MHLSIHLFPRKDVTRCLGHPGTRGKVDDVYCLLIQSSRNMCEKCISNFWACLGYWKNTFEMVYFIHLHIIHCLETGNKHTVPLAWNKTEIITHHQSQPWFHDPKTKRSPTSCATSSCLFGIQKEISTTNQHRHLTNQQNLCDQGVWGFGSRDKNIRQNRHNMSTPKQQGSLLMTYFQVDQTSSKCRVNFEGISPVIVSALFGVGNIIMTPEQPKRDRNWWL